MTLSWPSIPLQISERTVRFIRKSVSSSSSSEMTDRKYTRDPMREFIQLHQTTVPHVNQSYTWDCGLACVEMALRSRGVKVSVSDLREMCPTDSVWSIDIAYLLHKYNLRASFFTITKGVRPEYCKQEFYKEQLSEDTKRVNHLFATAEQNGIFIVQRSVSLIEIRDAIHDKNLLILILVDKRLLKCSLCDLSTAESNNLFSFVRSPGFLGHYILVYAYHPGSDKFLIKDPATTNETCVISATTLEQARMAFGTDQDILFIGNLDCES